MSLPRSKHGKQLDSRGPLIFDTRTLGPGSARSETRTVPAPAELRVAMAGVPEGSDLAVDVLLEGVAEGVLVTASVAAPLAGECARCLEPFSSQLMLRFQELFSRDADHAGPDGYLLVGDLVDLEPAMRDAVVLELPLSPLCTADCPGLCPECGIRLADADADAGHGHEQDSGVWAALRQLKIDARPEPDGAEPDGAEPDGSLHGSTDVPGRHPGRDQAKEH